MYQSGKIQDHKFAKLPLSSSLSPGNPVGKFKTKPVTEFRLLICHPASLQFSKQIQIHEYTYLETSKANRTAFGYFPYKLVFLYDCPHPIIRYLLSTFTLVVALISRIIAIKSADQKLILVWP